MPRPNLAIPIDYVTFRLDILVSIAKEDASRVYERESGVSLRDLRVLRNVAHQPGMMQGLLVERCYIEKTSLSKRVSALAAKGLLTRESSANDARQALLHLTPLGQETVEHCERTGRRLERAMLASLTERERAVFEDCIDKITSRLLLQREQAGVPTTTRLRR